MVCISLFPSGPASEADLEQDTPPAPTAEDQSPPALPCASLFESPWIFVKSVFHLRDLPPVSSTCLPVEVAFVGRSNVGKSSLVNALTKKGLAKTSSTPGRTQCLNYFAPANEDLFYLVDLPGYGFAKAPKDIVKTWQALMRAYLRGRPNLRRVFLLVDARHGLKKIDFDMMTLLNEAGVSFQVVLTKIDKISPSALQALVASTEKSLVEQPAALPTPLATSSLKKAGIQSLKDILGDIHADISN